MASLELYAGTHASAFARWASADKPDKDSKPLVVPGGQAQGVADSLKFVEIGMASIAVAGRVLRSARLAGLGLRSVQVLGESRNLAKQMKTDGREH